MASVFDVAKYILQQQGAMTAMKLQKLVYYSQAWSLVWDERSLFDEKIQAWANGPVVTELYERHRGQFQVSAETFRDGKVSNLNASQKDTIKKVLDFYGKKTAQWLSDLTHVEAPWKEARGELSKGERCNNEISLASMHEFYSSI